MNTEIQDKLYDKDFRNKLLSDPSQYAQELGYRTEGVEFKVVKNTPKKFYLPLNPHTGEVLDINNIQAAGSGSASSASSFGSLGTVCGTASTAASAACAGTVT